MQIRWLLQSSDRLINEIDKEYLIPTTDLKTFPAGILESRIPLKTYIENNCLRQDYDQENFMVSDLLKIDEEYRFFCIKDKIVTGSLYAKNGKLYKNSTVPIEVQSVAEEYVRLYQPSDIFVMDIAKSEKDYKIIEYNCWNASGLYEVNKLKLFSEVIYLPLKEEALRIWLVKNYYMTK